MYIFGYWPLPPYVHLASTHVMNVPRPSPFFAGLPLLCIVNAKVKWGRLGNEANGSHGEINQAFSLCICVMQAIKNWKWGGPGNEAKGVTIVGFCYSCIMLMIVTIATVSAVNQH